VIFRPPFLRAAASAAACASSSCATISKASRSVKASYSILDPGHASSKTSLSCQQTIHCRRPTLEAGNMAATMPDGRQALPKAGSISVCGVCILGELTESAPLRFLPSRQRRNLAETPLLSSTWAVCDCQVHTVCTAQHTGSFNRVSEPSGAPRRSRPHSPAPRRCACPP